MSWGSPNALMVSGPMSDLLLEGRLPQTNAVGSPPDGGRHCNPPLIALTQSAVLVKGTTGYKVLRLLPPSAHSHATCAHVR